MPKSCPHLLSHRALFCALATLLLLAPWASAAAPSPQDSPPLAQEPAADPVVWTLTAVEIRTYHNSSQEVLKQRLPPGVTSASDSFAFKIQDYLSGMSGNVSMNLSMNLTVPTTITQNQKVQWRATANYTISSTDVMPEGERGRVSYKFHYPRLPGCYEKMPESEDSAGNKSVSKSLSDQCETVFNYAPQQTVTLGAWANQEFYWFDKVYEQVNITFEYTLPPVGVRPVEGKVWAEGANIPDGRVPIADAGVIVRDEAGNELEHTVTAADGSYWLHLAPERARATVLAYLRNDNSFPSPVTFRYAQAPWENVVPGPIIYAETPLFDVGEGASAIHRDVVFSEASDAHGPAGVPHVQLDDLGLMYYRIHQAWEEAIKLGPGILQPVTVVPYSNVFGLFWSGPGTYHSPPRAQPVIINIPAGTGLSASSSWNTPDNREWHEYGHHVMADRFGGEMPRNDVTCPNPRTGEFSCYHAGFPNLNTNDSWTEGFAEFYSMLVAQGMENDPRPELYRWAGIEDNIESNYLAWTQTLRNPTVLPNWWSADEEFAVAGLLWDLLDPVDANDMTTLTLGSQTQTFADCVTMPVASLWSILTKNYGNTIPHSPVPPAGYGYIFDVKQLYDALKAAPVGEAHSRGGVLSDLDELFAAHGFFAEKHEDDYFWQSDEEIGRAANVERPGRRDREPTQGSYIAYTASDQATGAPVEVQLFKVDVRFDPPFETYNYSYVTRPEQPGLLPFHAPDPQYKATARISAVSNTLASVAPFVLNTQDYWKLMAQAPATSFTSASFAMKSLPKVFLPLLFGPRAPAAAAESADGLIWGSAEPAEARPAAKACVPDSATPTPTPTATSTPTATPTPTSTPKPNPGITGKVTFKSGVPPEKLSLDLEAYDGTDWSTLVETETGVDGSYLFLNVPTLGGGQAYRVAYHNTDVSPNPGPGYLWSWQGTKLEAYTANTWAAGGDFDVSDVEMNSPDDGATVQLPGSFCWTPRGIAGDTYRWVVYNLDLARAATTEWLGNASCVTIQGMPQGWPSGAVYVWWVQVAKGNPDTTPFNIGDSHGERYAVIRW